MIRITDGVFIDRVMVHNVEDVLQYLGNKVQMVSVSCWRAVAFAAVLTVRAFERGTNHAKTPGGELLLRLAKTLQIKDAIDLVGAKNGPNYVVVFGNEREVAELMEQLGLEGVPFEDCPDEIAKTFFEKSALVEVL